MAALAGKNIDWTKESCEEFRPKKPPSLEEPAGLAGITGSSRSMPSRSKPPSVTGRVFSFPIEALERQQQLLQTDFRTDAAGRPKVKYELGEILVAWLWGSLVRARIREYTEDTKGRHLPFSKHVPSILTFSTDVRPQLGIRNGEKYLRTATLYNCVKLKSSDMIWKEGMAIDKVLNRITRTFHSRAISFDAKAVRIRLGYMSRIWEHPGSLEHQVDSADENDVVIDWWHAPGRQIYFGSFDIGGQIIELGQPQFVRELPGSDDPGRCAILPRNPDPTAPFDVYIQLDEDAMERMTTDLEIDGVYCV